MSERDLVQKNNQFALNLFQKTRGQGNHVLSPLSVTYLMAMLADGTDGQTQAEMLNTLGWENATMADIDSLCSMLISKSERLDVSTTIKIANYIATNQDISLNSAYANSVDKSYKASIELLDFSKQSATQKVNDWCNKQTDGMIPRIVDQLNPASSLIAMNAIYFQGTWSDKFSKKMTKEENFRGTTRHIQRVPLMHQTAEFSYMDNDTLQAVALPYGNGAYEMVVLLPRDEFSIADMMKSVDEQMLTNIRYQMNNCKVDLKLPRFTIEQKTELNDIISMLGARTMFTPSADFSKMSVDSLYVSQMFQKAKIDVSEEGTKAAAVTAAIMLTSTAMPSEPRHVIFHADHPFVYFIMQRASEAILFVGQYVGQNQ